MPTCILVDETASLPKTPFAGREKIASLSLPLAAGRPVLPGAGTLLERFHHLARKYDHILVLCTSSELLPLAAVARQAAGSYSGRAGVSIIDSQSAGAGLGLLASLAAQALAGGAPPKAAEETIRAAIPRLYQLCCSFNPAALARSGLIHPAQAAALQALGLGPIFSLEEGALLPFHKARSRRHLLEEYQEFLAEFDRPQAVFLFKGPAMTLRARPLSETCANLFPDMPFAEQEAPPAYCALFGADSASLVVLDEKRRSPRFD
jgi:fatty acid-binding protein DegV